MQALNHTVFGSLIAVTITEPAIALPLALASHFILDMIPHYGDDPKSPRGSKSYYIRIVVDIIACFIVGGIFLSLNPPHAGLIVACIWVSVAPDILWPLALFIKQKGILWNFFKFHKKIQRESRSGIYLEIVWFAVTVMLFLGQVNKL